VGCGGEVDNRGWEDGWLKFYGMQVWELEGLGSRIWPCECLDLSPDIES
jgi:hypothetical protein